MPQPGEVRHGATESVQWDGQRWNPVQSDEPSISPAHGVGPSGLSAIGSLLGIPLGRAGAAIGSAIGSAANELSTSVPKLIEMARHGGGLTGPVDSRGVGQAMLDPLEHIGTDVAENSALNEIPGVVGSALSKGGRVIGRIGAAASGGDTLGAAARVGSGALAHLLGFGLPASLATEAATMAGPPLARAAGPLISAVGDAMPSTTMDGLKAALAALKPGLPEVAEESPTVLSGVELSPDAVARNIDATNMRDMEGFSHSQAGKLAGIPGAGESTAIDVPMGEHAITQEMIDAVKDKNFPGWDAPESVDPNWNGGSGDPMMAGSEPMNPRQEMPPSMQGLQDAVSPVDPLRAARDEAVRKYLNKSPNSALSQLAR